MCLIFLFFRLQSRRRVSEVSSVQLVCVFLSCVWLLCELWCFRRLSGSIDDVLGDLLGGDDDEGPVKVRSPALVSSRPSTVLTSRSGKRCVCVCVMMDDHWASFELLKCITKHLVWVSTVWEMTWDTDRVRHLCKRHVKMRSVCSGHCWMMISSVNWQKRLRKMRRWDTSCGSNTFNHSSDS